jgi:nitrate/TMAO reductase-like tetraheme cytochrome c subunit
MNSAIATLNCSVLTALTLLLASTTLSLLAEPEANRKVDNKSSNASSNDSYRRLSGEELWSNNCMRCHNIRPPTMYSDAQWDVIVHHMRVRANITGQEQRAIVEFLQSAK